MIKTTLLILFCILFTGCAAQSQLAKQDQTEWKQYKCSGIKSWNDCKQAALQDCPQGFYIKNELENITIQRREFETTCKG